MITRVIRNIKNQQATVAAVVVVGVLAAAYGYQSSIYSLVALVFLAAVMYVALHHGIRQGLISAGIVLVYNVASLGWSIESLTFGDRSVRRLPLAFDPCPGYAQ
ncbi:MAG TPA: hypothetical protein VK978_03100 [Candidatus Saccharimonadales bacterium]|nr:hypothetical protein [Candidatus Saccharimonadales bacterium]